MEEEGICQKRKWRQAAKHGEITPWEARTGAERRRGDEPDRTMARHERARELCHRCPALDACERYLSAMEKAGICISGIVAGRYSDTPPGNWKNGPARLPKGDEEERQTACRACHAPMWPQATPQARVTTLGGAQHAGEGLCGDCYPKFARHVRKRC